jgi:hypothetical protein
VLALDQHFDSLIRTAITQALAKPISEWLLVFPNQCLSVFISGKGFCLWGWFSISNFGNSRDFGNL